MNGKVRVIIVEGLDASGKESLSNTLVDMLEVDINESCKVIREEFPRYGTRTGETIRRILHGELREMKPELPQFFAMDRTDYMNKIERHTLSADVYIFDRYSRSNVYCNGCREDVIELAKKELELLKATISKVNHDKELEIIEICINYDFTDVDTKNASIALHETYMGTREVLDQNETISKQIMFADDMHRSYALFREPEMKLTLGFDIAETAKSIVTDKLGYSFKEYRK